MTKLKVQLRPFQLEGVRQIYRFRGRALLADEMGLGKTIQSLFWLYKLPSYRPAIILCPSSVKFNWQSEASHLFGMHIDVLEGRKPKHLSLSRKGIYVLNYDILPGWLRALSKLHPKILIIDEIQFIKNLRASRTKATLKLAEQMKSVVGLSGTPLVNKPFELWPVLRAIRPDLFPDVKSFAWRYCAPRWTYWGWRFDGATHLKELNKILRRECMIRRLKRDVLQDLPEKIEKVVAFRLKSYKEYNEATHNFISWLRRISPSRAARAKRSQALTKIGYLIRLTAQLKLKWTAQWVADFLEANPERKLVAFTMHTFVIDHLRERFPDISLVIDGRITGRKRHEAVRQFRSHSKKRLMLGNWVAAGVGITLTAASDVAALDFPWTPGDLAQGIARSHRIGQKREVTTHYLVAQKTIEEKQVRVLKRKRGVLDSVLDGKRATKDIDIFDELLKELNRENQ